MANALTITPEVEKEYLVLAKAINLAADRRRDMEKEEEQPEKYEEIYNESIDLWEQMQEFIKEKI